MYGVRGRQHWSQSARRQLVGRDIMAFGVLEASQPIADQPWVLVGQKSLQTHQKNNPAARGSIADKESVLYGLSGCGIHHLILYIRCFGQE